jgi:hypothetical protein
MIPTELSDEEIAAALDNPDPRANKQGDGGNLELWDRGRGIGDSDLAADLLIDEEREEMAPTFTALVHWLKKPDDLKCVACGSDRVLKIHYGMPSREVDAASSEGKLVLGGCMVGRPGGDPKWCCRDCGKRFGMYDVAPGRTIGSDGSD